MFGTNFATHQGAAQTAEILAKAAQQIIDNKGERQRNKQQSRLIGDVEPPLQAGDGVLTELKQLGVKRCQQMVGDDANLTPHITKILFRECNGMTIALLHIQLQQLRAQAARLKQQAVKVVTLGGKTVLAQLRKCTVLRLYLRVGRGVLPRLFITRQTRQQRLR